VAGSIRSTNLPAAARSLSKALETLRLVSTSRPQRKGRSLWMVKLLMTSGRLSSVRRCEIGYEVASLVADGDGEQHLVSLHLERGDRLVA